MEYIKKIIEEELTRLIERDYKAPPEIKDALEDKLKMKPLIRYVDSFKAINSIPPSYEVRLLNGQSFAIYYEDFSLMVKIGAKEYYLMDMAERSEAIEDINRLLTIKQIQPFTAPEEEETGGDSGGDTGGTSTPSSGGSSDSDVAMEPDEEGDESEDEEPAGDEEEV